MSNDPLDNLQRRDFVSSLMLWVLAEVLGFLLLPQLGLIRPSPEIFQTWVIRSLPLGVGGALLISFTSGMVLYSRNQGKPARAFTSLLAAVGGVLGIGGILYPLIVSCAEFFSKGLPQ
jgi:hypothetical protein